MIISITNDIEQWGGIGKRVWKVKYQKELMASDVEELTADSFGELIKKLEKIIQ